MTQADSSRTKSLKHSTLLTLLRRRTRGLSLLVTILAGIAIWLVFYPATMSQDSMEQYAQAKTGAFDTLRPPVMSILMWLFLRVGLDIGSLTLVQCLAGMLGLRAMLLATVRLLRGRCALGDYWAVTGTLLALVSPWTPAAIYLTTFWKDSWTAIAFAWLVAVFLELFRRAGRLSRAGFLGHLLLLIALMTFAGLPRHNTLTSTPAMGLMLVLVLIRRRGQQGRCVNGSDDPRSPQGLARRGHRIEPASRFDLPGTWRDWIKRPTVWLAAAVPPVCVLSAGSLLVRLFDVKQVHLSNEVLAIDLMGIYVYFPELRSEIPYTCAHMRSGIEEYYRLGEIAPMTSERPEIVDPEYIQHGRNPQLDAEYRHVMTACPGALAYVKLGAFLRQLDPARTRVSYFNREIIDNPYGLIQNATLRPIRSLWYSAATLSTQIPLTRWINYHAVWYDLGLIGLGVCLWRMRRGEAGSLLGIALLLLPLSYVSGYVFGMTAMAYRYLYPATFVMQFLAAGILIVAWSPVSRLIRTPDRTISASGSEA